MSTGPIFRRALLATSRIGGEYADRSLITLILVTVVVALALIYDWNGWDRSSVAAAARFAYLNCAVVAAMLTIMTMTMVSLQVSHRIAGERDRKTLDALLATRLTSLEIVAGTMAAGLLMFAVYLASCLPVMILLVWYGGIDTRLVLLIYAGLAGLGFAMAAMGVVASVGGRTGRRARASAAFMMMVWMFFPFFVVIFKPRLWPSGPSWLTTVGIWVLESSPLGVVMNFVGLFRRGTPLDATLRMITLDVGAGLALLAWAAFRLRPASRALYDVEGRSVLRRMSRLKWRRRPPCGDDPVLWYEKYSTRGQNLFDRLFGMAVGLGVTVAVVAATYGFAKPAFFELAERGYGASASTGDSLGVNPAMQYIVLWMTPNLAPGQARSNFNGFLKHCTLGAVMLYFLLLVSFGAEGVVAEKERDTWLGLITTPLTGREIMRAKMLGAVWRARFWVGLLIAVWIPGLLSGALHPVGFLAAFVVLGVTTWCFVATGLYYSLRSKDRKHLNNITALPMMLMIFGGMALGALPEGRGSVLFASVATPWLVALPLVSYEEVRAASGPGGLPALAVLGIRSGEGVWPTVFAVLIGLSAHLAVAVYYTRAAFCDFDALVGRPVRRAGAEQPPASRSPEPVEIAVGVASVE